ncbi:MAG: 2-hydroxychromene-2-carboxylate isomerase [Magnetovibrio sp.]|nr:2-hydroxychromene-2-carboxylate isomerase [Magnetovibrio sp.]
MKKLFWYFDFISPYAYFQSTRLNVLTEKVEIHCIPILFAGLLDFWGQKGPAEVKPKKLFTFRHCAWRAYRDNIPYQTPSKHPFNPLRALRLSIALGNNIVIIQKIFNCIWVNGYLPDDEDGWLKIKETLNAEHGDELIADEKIKLELLENGKGAIAAGVFGVPTLRIDDELFWGDDCLDMVQFYIDNPGVLKSKNMRRILELKPSSRRIKNS